MAKKDRKKAEYVKIEKERINAFEGSTFLLGVITSVLSAIICMQTIAKVGVTPNTSMIGVIFAVMLSRIPFNSFMRFRSTERQNLVQTAISTAGFAAANCGFLSVAIFYVLGETSFIFPMAIGSLCGVLISVLAEGMIFDSIVFPASGPWPPGVAVAQAIEAGDEGGTKGKRLLQGLIVGVIGSYFKLPAAGIGIVFISNIFSMAALGIGLILRGYSTSLVGFDIGATYIPHGIMIGAGVMALIQSIMSMFKGNKGSSNNEPANYTHSDEDTKKNMVKIIGLFFSGAFLLALITGIMFKMPFIKFILWLIWATFSATVAMLIVGMAAMNSGWFPGFAVTTIFMTIGIFFKFPIIPLALLTGYVTSVGPCFADMGYDLKTGWILRGNGEDREYELYQRKQQVHTQLYGGAVGIIVMLLTLNLYFKQDLIPPISRVFAATISAGAESSTLMTLLKWAVPGVILQLIFGPDKMVGVLFATGLLINNPIYGIGVLAAVVVRMIFGTEFMEIRDAGLIAGDGIYGFFDAVFKAFLN